MSDKPQGMRLQATVATPLDATSPLLPQARFLVLVSCNAASEPKLLRPRKLHPGRLVTSTTAGQRLCDATAMHPPSSTPDIQNIITQWPVSAAPRSAPRTCLKLSSWSNVIRSARHKKGFAEPVRSVYLRCLPRPPMRVAESLRGASATRHTPCGVPPLAPPPPARAASGGPPGPRWLRSCRPSPPPSLLRLGCWPRFLPPSSPPPSPSPSSSCSPSDPRLRLAELLVGGSDQVSHRESTRFLSLNTTPEPAPLDATFRAKTSLRTSAGIWRMPTRMRSSFWYLIFGSSMHTCPKRQ